MQEPRQLDIFSDNGIETGSPQQLELPLEKSAPSGFVSLTGRRPTPPTDSPPIPSGAQLKLFSDKKFKAPVQKEVIDVDTLQAWKNQILEYQQQARATQPTEQKPLFDIPELSEDYIKVDPLELNNQVVSKFKGTDYLYFVLDKIPGLILYIGEQKVNKKLKKVHELNEYITVYQELHNQHKLKTLLNIVFWQNVPQNKERRDCIREYLILKWRPPFNKQSFQWWGLPF